MPSDPGLRTPLGWPTRHKSRLLVKPARSPAGRVFFFQLRHIHGVVNFWAMHTFCAICRASFTEIAEATPFWQGFATRFELARNLHVFRQVQRGTKIAVIRAA